MNPELKKLQKAFYKSDASHRYLSRADQERLFRRWSKQGESQTGPVAMVERGLPSLIEGVLALLCLAAFAVLLGKDYLSLPEWTRWIPVAALAGLMLRMQFFARYRVVESE